MDYELDEGFKVTNDKLADWCIRKIKEGEDERDRLIKIAEDQIEDLKAKIEDLKAKCDNQNGFLKGCLAAYFTTVPHKETKTQESYKLLSGSLVMKKPMTKIVYDETNLLQYLKDSGDNKLIKIKESVDWATFKKDLSVTDDGQVVDTATGTILDKQICTTEDVPASFDIKF